MGGGVRPFAFQTLLPDPPVPIAAEIVSGVPSATVTFDKPLTAGALNPINFSVRDGTNAFTTDSAVAAGNVVSLGLSVLFPFAAAPAVIYSPTFPVTITGTDGAPVAAFNQFATVL